MRKENLSLVLLLCCGLMFFGHGVESLKRNHTFRAKISKESSSFFDFKCPLYPLPVAIPDIQNNSLIKNALNSIDNLVGSYVLSQEVPGFFAVVAYDQQILWNKGYGKANYFDKNSPPPSLDTLTRIASISKTFTDLMLFVLRDNKTVQFDDPVSKYLKNFSIKNPYKTNKEISLRELASHTSGLPREIPCPWEKLNVCSESDILSKLSQFYVIMPQYNRPHYSNLGIALLGRTLEKAVSQKFEDFAKYQILNPLGMTGSGFIYDDYTKKHLGVGVIFLRNGTAIPAPVEDLGWGNPMGGMFASGKDMATYMSFLFRTNAKSGGNQILDGSSIAEFLKPVILTHDGTAGFGTPWEFNYTLNHWVTSKAGELDGYRSQIALIPELKLGVFTTAFVTDVSDPTVLNIPILSQLVPVLNQVLWGLQPNSSLPSNYKLFLGTYVNTNSGDDVTTIYVKNQVLLADTQGTTVNLTAFEYDPLVLRMKMVDVMDVSCRGLDDGVEFELIYFQLNDKKDHASQVMIMGEIYQFTTDFLKKDE